MSETPLRLAAVMAAMTLTLALAGDALFVDRPVSVATVLDPLALSAGVFGGTYVVTRWASE